jgi:hypothetical protein
MNSLDRRFKLITLICFIVLIVPSVILVVYYADTSEETSCKVIGTFTNESACHNVENCGYIRRADRGLRYYYRCTCYGGYVNISYNTNDAPSTAILRVQYDILNVSIEQKNLKENYPDGSIFTCYYDKFDANQISLEYNNGWIFLIIIDVVICLLISVLIPVADKVIRTKNY